ncbi:MAG: thiamine phosphate synthase [bacterium]|nr:thiamine phosphate synthase [bacterium]
MSASLQTPGSEQERLAAPKFPGPGVYPLLDHDTCRKRELDPLAVLSDWRDGGIVRYYQWRAKTLSDAEYLEVARELRRHAPELALFANDRIELVLGDDTRHRDQPEAAVFAGLHLGQEDLLALPDADLERLRELRRRRPDFVLGLSTHGVVQITGAAPQQGFWSYLALGPCFPTDSKPTGRDPVLSAAEFQTCLGGLAGALSGRELSSGFPLVLIGGINGTNIEELLNLYAGVPHSERIQPVVAGIGSTLDATQISDLRGKIQKYNS